MLHLNLTKSKCTNYYGSANSLHNLTNISPWHCKGWQWHTINWPRSSGNLARSLGSPLKCLSYSVRQAALSPPNMTSLKGLPQKPGLPMSVYSGDACHSLTMSRRFTTTGGDGASQFFRFSMSFLVIPVSLTRSFTWPITVEVPSVSVFTRRELLKKV